MSVDLEVSNETSACSGCSCLHEDFDVFNIGADFTQ